MYELQIKSVSKDTSVETGDRFLAVEFEITKGEDVVLTKNVGFPMGTPVEEVKEELKKHLENYKVEMSRKKAQEAIDKEDKNADNIIKELEGKKL